MAQDIQDKAAVEARLWDEIAKHPTGMLGLVGGAAQHFQPMTATLERDEARFWFFTYRDVDIAQSAMGGHEAMFVVQREHEIFACVEGDLTVEHDPERIARYWNAAVAAWYPGGKDDPRLTLLCFEARDAVVWIHDAGPLRVALELAKARIGKSRPALSERTPLDFEDREGVARGPHTSVPGSFAP